MKGASAARIGFLAAAGLASLRAIVELFEPRYWDPQNIVDYLSVAAMSAMLLGLSVALTLLTFSLRRSGLKAAPMALTAAAVGSSTAGISNALEDGVRWRAFVAGFFLGLLLLAVSMFIAGVATLITRRAWMLGVCLLLLAGAPFFSLSRATGTLALAACCLVAAFYTVRPAYSEGDHSEHAGKHDPSY